MEPIYLYDTTLRDGTQGENITFSADEKVKIALRLDDIGIHYIEGGWPGSNPKDADFFKKARSLLLNTSKLVAFGSTRRANPSSSGSTRHACTCSHGSSRSHRG